jgi:hypothetical protein
MKQHFYLFSMRYLLTLMLLSSVIPAFTQVKNHTNNLIIWGGGGYGKLMNGSSETSVSGKPGFILGCGYEWNIKNISVQTGLELSHYSSTMAMKDTLLVLSMVDTDGDTFDGYFYFNNTKDNQSITNLSIPLMIGYQSPSGFYIMGGGKIGVTLTGSSKTTSEVTSMAYYENLIGNNGTGFFTNMPNHGLDTEPRSMKSSIKFNSIFFGSLEAGWNFGKNRETSRYIRNKNVTYRLGLFLDYGFAPVTTKNRVDYIIVNSSNTEEIVPAIQGYLTHNVSSGYVNTLLVGVKLTVLFNLDKKECKCEF